MDVEQTTVASVAPPGLAATPDAARRRVQARTRAPRDVPWRPMLAVVFVLAAAGAAYVVLAPGTQSRSDAARAVLKDFRDAVRKGDGARACALVTPASQAGMAQLAHRAGSGETCAASVALVGAEISTAQQRLSPAQWQQFNAGFNAPLGAVEFSADGSHATVTISDGSKTSRTILVRDDGRWLIDMNASPAAL